VENKAFGPQGQPFTGIDSIEITYIEKGLYADGVFMGISVSVK
jgi:hypothetical protein